MLQRNMGNVIKVTLTIYNLLNVYLQTNTQIYMFGVFHWRFYERDNLNQNSLNKITKKYSLRD